MQRIAGVVLSYILNQGGMTVYVTVKKKAVIDWSTIAALTAVCLLLLHYPNAMATGISRGLSICSTVIIPTLYPFMLLAGILANSPLCRRPGRGITAVTGWLFGLPGCCGPAILLSLVGGYPAGAIAIARLRERGQITPEETRRMTAFCVNGGPGFIVSTVGAGLLGSVQAGVMLYAAQVAVSVGIGIALGRGRRRVRETAQAPLPPPKPMAQVVSDTCAALLTMCGFVVLAAAGLALAEGCGFTRGVAAMMGIDAATVSAVLAAVTEVSCGCVAMAGGGTFTPLWLSLALSWGGLSVQGQLAAVLPSERLIGLRFWRWRLLHGALSGGVAMALFALFPIHRATLQSGTAVVPYSVSAAATLMLLLLSFLAMLCFSQFSEKKTGNAS